MRTLKDYCCVGVYMCIYLHCFSPFQQNREILIFPVQNITLCMNYSHFVKIKNPKKIVPEYKGILNKSK